MHRIHPLARPLLVALLLLTGAGVLAQTRPDPIDWNRARVLYQRSQRGETLSPEDQAYLDRAKAERAGGPRQPAATRPDGPAGGARGAGAPPATQATGLVPLCDMGAGQTYKGQSGGLYGGGSNTPPEAHRKAAEAQLAAITPLDATGKPAADGKVVLMSIGMSNTTQEFSRFKQLADADPAKSPALVIVDAAQGGQAGAQWADADRGRQIWANADQRLERGGVTPAQVQVLWIKQAEMGPARLGEFPRHAEALQKNVVEILNLAKKRYPNVRIAYLSSRIYAGYAMSGLNPEPYAYEGAFSMRWVIESQIKGDANLNHDPAKGPVVAPLVLWGPYLWADGTRGRAADNLAYTRDDLGRDGTHPSETGRTKVAEQLLKFFKTDPLAKGWFAKP